MSHSHKPPQGFLLPWMEIQAFPWPVGRGANLAQLAVFKNEICPIKPFSQENYSFKWNNGDDFL